jgi:hypothetical protein
MLLGMAWMVMNSHKTLPQSPRDGANSTSILTPKLWARIATCRGPTEGQHPLTGVAGGLLHDLGHVGRAERRGNAAGGAQLAGDHGLARVRAGQRDVELLWQAAACGLVQLLCMCPRRRRAGCHVTVTAHLDDNMHVNSVCPLLHLHTLPTTSCRACQRPEPYVAGVRPARDSRAGSSGVRRAHTSATRKRIMIEGLQVLRQ